MRCDLGAGAPPGVFVGFTPRQVLLSQRPTDPIASVSVSNENTAVRSSSNMIQKAEFDSLIACSVAVWLENKGFAKVLKRFLSAASIQDDNWKDKGIDLNVVFSKYQETLRGAHEDGKIIKKPGEQEIVITQSNVDGDVKTTEENGHVKKKKKNKIKVDDSTAALEGLKDSEVQVETNRVAEDKKSRQTKKKKKVEEHAAISASDAVASNGVAKDTKESCDNWKQDQNPEELTEHNVQSVSESKSKDKKKAKNKNLSSHSSDHDSLDKELVSVQKSEDLSDGNERVCKKRKREASDGNDHSIVEELKPNKLTTSEEISSGHPGLENGQKDGLPAPVSPNVDKSSDSKSLPKKVIPFQRVRVEEVKFADERLQDNSYWAKDGAEIGYGAKAQEVLGQVKGRDFRHEKTKKKRGSYRGGQIDLQSHSIKFNYSDEE